MTKQKVIKLKKEVQKILDQEFKKYGGSINFELVYQKGQQLAKKLKANQDVVALGIMLMDLKIGYAFKIRKVEQHIFMAIKATKTICKRFRVDKGFENQILHCIEAHHGNISYQTKEAEICANADCYRFLTCYGVIQLLLFMGDKLKNKKLLEMVEFKVEEKYKTVSLSLVKKELLPNYKVIKQFLNKAQGEL